MTISLDDMAQLARALVEADEGVEQAEESLKRAKERARMLREETIPSAMQELGIEELKLDTGQKLSVKQEVYASIPADKKGQAFTWLEDNGFGGLIKVGVSVDFGKGEIDVANDFFESLCDSGYDPNFDTSVHPSTLKAFLKEQIASGASIPLDLFGARPVWTAKITKK